MGRYIGTEDAVLMFVSTTDEEEILRRIRESRSSSDNIESRIASATRELELYKHNADKFDHLIFNDSLESVRHQLIDILKLT